MWCNDVKKASAALSSRRNLRGPSPLTPLPVGEGDRARVLHTVIPESPQGLSGTQPRRLDKVPDICSANSGMTGGGVKREIRRVGPGKADAHQTLHAASLDGGYRDAQPTLRLLCGIEMVKFSMPAQELRMRLIFRPLGANKLPG